MATNILSIGQSALSAAQIGISVTGHNIANASTPGYSRQVLVQNAAEAQNFGFGYIGQGTQVSSIQRVYNDILARQVTNSQSTSNQVNTYASQMKQIDNMLSDASAGLSPSLQDFFNSLQVLSTNPGDAASRQAMLSSAQSLANRFQSLGSRLYEIRESVNAQVTSSVSLVNTYAKQIAQLNDAIEKAVTATGNPPNDLMDQRDQLITDLSKQIKTTVVSQDGGKYNVFIGNGLPLVVGANSYGITTMNSPTDGGRLEVAYQSNGKTTILGQSSVTGGVLGGLVEFRNDSLDSIQNQLGLIAVTLAENFNSQHAQALDANGNPGGNFFSVPVPLVGTSTNNAGNGVVGASIVDVKSLTASDYKLEFDGSNYNVTRLSDGQVQSFSSLPQTVDGVQFTLKSGAMAAGDNYLIQPTISGASALSVVLKDINKIATGAPVATSAALAANTGNATISAPQAGSNYVGNPLAAAFAISYDSATTSFSGFPATQPVTVTVGGVSTTYPAGSSIPFTAGAQISVAGLTFTISGNPNNGDQFSVSPGTSSGPGDNRNALLLAALQTSNSMANGTTTYQGAFGQLVSLVGNKTNELQVTGDAENQMLTLAVNAQQSESGVNLDEEATNLLRYQQAYQAAGKMMQIASQMFEVLLSLGQG